MALKINPKKAPEPETKAAAPAAANNEASGAATKPKVGLKLTKKPAPGAAVETKQAEATITTEHKHKGVQTGVEETKEPVGEVQTGPAGQPWCEITVHASFSKNLGDYNNTKVGVSLKMPCVPEEIEDAYTVTKEWVNGKLSEMMDELNAA